MPKDLFEIKTFNKGIISSPSESDIPQDAASYSLDVNPNGIDGKLSARKEDTTKYDGSSTSVSFQSSGRVVDPANTFREDYILHDKSSGNVDLITDFSGTPSVTENVDTGVTGTESNTIEAYSKNVRIAHSASSSVKWIGYTPTNQFGTAHSGIQAEVAKLSTLTDFEVYKKIIKVGSDFFGLKEGGTEIYKHDSSGNFIAKSKLDFKNTTAICEGTYDDLSVWVYDKDEGTRGTLYKLDPSGMNIIQVNPVHDVNYPKAYWAEIYSNTSNDPALVQAASENTGAYISDMKILYQDGANSKDLIISMYGEPDEWTSNTLRGYTAGLVYKLNGGLPSTTGILSTWIDMTPRHKFTTTELSASGTPPVINGTLRPAFWGAPNVPLADETDTDAANYNVFIRDTSGGSGPWRDAKPHIGAVQYYPSYTPLGGQLSGQGVTNHTDNGAATYRGDSFSFYATVFSGFKEHYGVSGTYPGSLTYTAFTDAYAGKYTEGSKDYGAQAYLVYGRTGSTTEIYYLDPVRYCIFNIHIDATTSSTNDFLKSGVDVLSIDMDSSDSDVSQDLTTAYAMKRASIHTWKDPANGYGEYRYFLASQGSATASTGEIRFQRVAASVSKPSTTVDGSNYYYDLRWRNDWGIGTTSGVAPHGDTYGPTTWISGKNAVSYCFVFSGDMSAGVTPTGNIFFGNTSGSGEIYKLVLDATLSNAYTLIHGSDLGMTATQDGAVGAGFTNGKKYWYKVSLLYDEFQESILFGEVIGTSTGTGGFSVVVTLENWANALAKRVTHVNLYRAEGTGSQPDSLFRLVKSASIQGILWSGTTDRSYTFWDFSYDNITVTYDANAGISQSLEANYLDYSKGVVLNSHLFVTNAGNSELSSVSNYVFKSLPFKYDMFDWSRDFVACPEDLNAIIAYSGRLYGMSDNNTYRIEPNTLYIEDTFNGIGCISQEAFVVTEFGLFFCDQNNIYMHNGQAPVPIGSAILTSPSGNDGYKEMLNVATFSPKVAFDSKEQNVIFFVKNDKALVYNIVRSRWDLWTGLDAKSCFSSADGRVYASVGNDIKGYATGTANKSSFTWISKEISAGHQSQDKKFYRIDCPHEGNAPTVSYGFNGAAPSSTATAANSTGLASVKLNEKKRSIQVKIVSGNANTFIESLGLVFRRFLKLVGVS